MLPQPGYTQTYDLDGLGTPNCANRMVDPGETATDVDFGYQPPPSTVDLFISKTAEMPEFAAAAGR